MRDAILHALEEDPTLEPRDVIVMCPDIETFAPLIQATFGAGEAPDGRAARDAAGRRPPGRPEGPARRPIAAPDEPRAGCRRAADRPRRRAADGVGGARPRRPRAGPATVPLRRRRPDAAAGLGRRERDPLGPRRAPTARPSSSTALPAGTWRAGLDRLLVGVTMTEDEQRLFAGVLPLDDVESGAIDLAGRFAELVDRLQAAVDALSDPKPIDALGGRDRDRRRRADRDDRPGRVAARRASAPARRRRRGGDGRRHGQPDEPRARGGARAARRTSAGPPHPGKLPHRPPDDLHARADALGPAPGRLPARARRRRLSAQGRRATATTSCSTTRTSASATRGPRTASCCSTRCWPRPTG